MRKGTIIFLVINLIVIGYLVNAFSTLISLLFEDKVTDAILRSEIPAPGSDLIENRTQLIPKIIHQTYINSSIPARWQEQQQSCIDLHPDYEYMVRFIVQDFITKANCEHSSGLTPNPASLSPQSTLGFSRLSIAIHSQSNVQIPFATSFSPSTVVPTSTSTMAAIGASIPYSVTPPGYALRSQRASVTMPWVLSLNIPSSPT